MPGQPIGAINLAAGDPLVDPFENEVGDLQVILVLHDHVAVAAAADFGRADHLRPTAGSVEAADHGLTCFVPGLPRGERWHARRRITVIAEDDQDRQLRERGDLFKVALAIIDNPSTFEVG